MINSSSEASPASEKEREAVATSNEKVDASPKLGNELEAGESDMYSSTSSSSHIDASKAPENTPGMLAGCQS